MTSLSSGQEPRNKDFELILTSGNYIITLYSAQCGSSVWRLSGVPVLDCGRVAGSGEMTELSNSKPPNLARGAAETGTALAGQANRILPMKLLILMEG